MNNYAREHADALAALREDGAAASFTLRSDGTLNAATGETSAPTSTTVSGYAIKVAPKSQTDLRAFAEGSLGAKEALMLLFAATTINVKPAIGSEVIWNGVGYSVKGFGDDIAPGGPVVCSRPVIAR